MQNEGCFDNLLVPTLIHVFLWIWLSGMAVTLTYLATASVTMGYLKRVHRSTWIELGSPSLILNNSLINNWLTFKFVASGRWRRLGDPALDKRIRIVTFLWFACLTDFTTLAAFAAYFKLSNFHSDVC